MENFNELTGIAGMVIITGLIIREIFSYLREKHKNENEVSSVDASQLVEIAVLNQKIKKIEVLTTNHLSHIEKDISFIREDIKEICQSIEKLEER